MFVFGAGGPERPSAAAGAPQDAQAEPALIDELPAGASGAGAGLSELQRAAQAAAQAASERRAAARLVEACRSGDVPAAERCLVARCAIDLPCAVVTRRVQPNGKTTVGSSGFAATALWWAAEGGHADVVRLLLGHGADTEVRSRAAKKKREREKKRGDFLSNPKKNLGLVARGAAPARAGPRSAGGWHRGWDKVWGGG